MPLEVQKYIGNQQVWPKLQKASTNALYTESNDTTYYRSCWVNTILCAVSFFSLYTICYAKQINTFFVLSFFFFCHELYMVQSKAAEA